MKNIKVTVHRGTKEIGGTCVELTNAKNQSIILDMGIPLSDETKNKSLKDMLPQSLALDPKKHLGVLVSHAHQDHYGLLKIANEYNIQIFANEITKKIMDVSSFWLPNTKEINNINTFQIGSSFPLGDFEIKSYKVDHTYDSVAFLIKVDEQKIFYSGDFRSHGNVKFYSYLLSKKELKNIDIMLIEGTTVGNSESHKSKPEEVLIDEFVDFFNGHDGLGLIACSSQNFDRIVNIIKAKNILKKELVIDGYTYDILHAYGNEKLNDALTKAKVFMPNNQRVKIKNSERFDKLCPKHQRIYEQDFVKNYKNYIVLYKKSYNTLFEKIPECLQGAKLAFSMWQGYFLKDDFLQSFIKKYDICCKQIHTSGHASFQDIKKMIEKLKPQAIIPIHTENPHIFKKHFTNCIIQSDGEAKTYPLQQETDMSKISRGISEKFAEMFIKTDIFEHYLHHSDELFLAIRNDYINIYYKSKSIAKVSGKQKLTFEIHEKYLDDNKNGQTYKKFSDKGSEIVKSYEEIKTRIDEKYSNSKEKTAQQKIILNNNRNVKAKYFCLDMEYAKQRNNNNEEAYGRFDIIAVKKAPPYNVALIELKFGSGALGGSSGVLKHSADFISFIEKNVFNNHLRNEIIDIIKSYEMLGIRTPFEELNPLELAQKPDFYFITLNNIDDKPLKSMQKHFSNDSSVASKKNDKTFNPKFLFSEDDGSNICDILHDERYNIKIRLPEFKTA